MPRHTIGSLTIAACALAWGLIGVVVREVDLPAMAIVFWRVALAAAFVAAVLAVRGRRDLLSTRGNRSPLALGLLLALHWSLYFAAIKETSVASAVVITYAAPIMMALLAPLVIGERVTRVSVLALAVSAGGILAITLSGGEGAGEVRALGVVLAVLAAATYAVLVVSVKRFAAEVNPLTFVLYQSSVAALALAPAAVLAGLPADAGDAALLAVLGIVLTGLTGVLYVASLQTVAATTAGILSYVEPVSAALLAVLLLGERLTLGMAIGGLAIVAAGVAVVRQTPERLSPPLEEPLATR
jgi:drug/metabolite transporter, DME family